jgi:hypothetical protein
MSHPQYLLDLRGERWREVYSKEDLAAEILRLRAALKVEARFWAEELANCNGRDAADRALKRLAAIGEASHFVENAT